MRIKSVILKPVIIFIAIIITGCSGSNGSDGSDGDDALTYPSVVYTSPDDNDINVDRSAVITVAFNKAMDTSTITADSFIVKDQNNVTKAGTLSFGGHGEYTVSFTPAAKYNILHKYSVTVLSTVKDTQGNSMGYDYSCDFTVNEGSWLSPQLVESDNSIGGQDVRIAFDTDGNAIAVWCRSDGVRNNIWANRYTAGAGWGNAELIETGNAANAMNPQIAVDPNGNAIAVWCQSDGVTGNIHANRYTAGTGWGTALLIETDNTGNANFPRIAFDKNGNAVAVWEQYDATRKNIWSNRYTAGTGWGTAELVETDNSGHAYSSQIAIDPDGNALAVWCQWDGSNNNIYSNRYTAGTGWGSVKLVDSEDLGSADSPRIAFDSNGNAIAVWFQYDGVRNNIWANRYKPGSGWEKAQLIESDNTSGAFDPWIAFDPNGNAIAVWVQSDGSYNNICANRYTAGAGWGAAQLIETGNAGNAYSPQIVFDPGDNATVVWYQTYGSRTNICSNRYISGSGWKGAEIIENNNAGIFSNPQIAVDPGGNVFAAWYQYDGGKSFLWAKRFE